MAGLDEEQRRLLKGDDYHRPFESKVRHLLDEETEQEDQDRIQQIMADLEEYKQLDERTKTEAEVNAAKG